MDWDNVEESDIIKLQETIEKLTIYATVKEEVIDPALGERMKLSYGRIFVSDFVQSFEVRYYVVIFWDEVEIGFNYK